MKKFSRVYVPWLINLLNQYLSLPQEKKNDAQSEVLRIEIAKAKDAFLKLNDDLLQQISFEIQAEIDTLDSILSVDGLLNSQEMVLPDRDQD